MTTEDKVPQPEPALLWRVTLKEGYCVEVPANLAWQLAMEVGDDLLLARSGSGLVLMRHADVDLDGLDELGAALKSRRRGWTTLLDRFRMTRWAGYWGLISWPPERGAAP